MFTPAGATRRLTEGARAAAQVALGAGRHVAWYVRYRVDGDTHERVQEPNGRPRRDRR